ALLMGLLILVAGWGVYLLACDLYAAGGARSRWVGLTAGVVYLYTPYLLVNLYVRGALAELLAQALLPWLFWCVTRIFTTATPRRYTLGAASLLGLVALGHNITLLLLPLLLGPYVIMLLFVAPLEHSEQLKRVAALAGWSLVAAGVTAFFWMPVIAERSLLSDLAFNAPNLAEHVWSFTSFLEPNFAYDYGVSSVPFRLGLVQAVAALAGLLLTRVRTSLWWFWVGLGAVAMIGITPAILPLWQSVELLSIVQFPWRLLTVVTLSTALVTGGIVTLARGKRWEPALAGGVMLLIILGGRPTLATFNTSMYADIAVDPAAIARYEAGYGAWGAGWHLEFLPKWAETFVDAPAIVPQDAAAPDQVVLKSVTPTGIQLTVESDAPAALRLNQFYFPGWHATLNRTSPLAIYPSPQQGLVTVDLPAGAHTVEIFWADSTVQNAAEWLTLATLFVLGAVLLRWRRWRLAGMGVLVVALLATVMLKSPLQSRTAPVTPVQAEVLPGLTLLGYETALAPNGRSLLITPYWYLRTANERMRIAWRLVDAEGEVVSEIDSVPYYGTLPSERWLQGTVIRDGYRLPLPLGAAAGDYALQFRPRSEQGRADWTRLGVVSAPALPAPHPVDVVFTDPQSGEQVVLVGYTVDIGGVEQAVGGERPPLVRPGDLVTIRLFWRAQRDLSEDYHSFLHLVSHERQTLVALDKIPGQEIARPRFWDRAYAEPDTYKLRIPADAAPGLYYPRVGFYDYDDLDRFLLTIGEVEDDAIDLAPLKIAPGRSQQAAAPQHPLRVAYGDFAQVLGYTLTPDTTTVRPGESFTVTVFYRGVQPADRAYTQFFQLYSPVLGMAAQADQPPQRGGNPTHTWQPGEIVVDQVVLTIKPEAVPGEYWLNTGMYDPVSGERASLAGEDGAPLPDNQVPLLTLTVEE
ncbi:MAG: 6-pyruvoyl-tetrahydropterin synthase-related protein, partial [Caldilinea sp.]